VLTIFPYSRVGSEFMPPLNEGTLLYMPTAVPGMSITEATKILQIQDRQLKKIPEAVTVFGKAGQAETPGQYRAKVKAAMAGDWNARVSYNGPRGKGQTSLSLNIKQ
jgi:Cu/Ag efflux pump CusA